MKLIKLNTDHYVIVDDSEIKEGDWYLTFQNNEVIGELRKCEDSSYSFIHCKKITHSTQPLEVNNLYRKYDFINIKSISLSEVKELIGKVDLEKKAEEVFPYKETRTDFATEECREIYKIGYNQAIEDNKDKKYTRNEVHGLMCKAFEQGFKKADVVDAGLESKETDVECAWILKVHGRPKTEWSVEFIDGKLKLK